MNTSTIDRLPPPEGTVGAFPGIDIEAYHADKSAVSKSALDDFARAPALYWHNRFDPDKPADADEETAARLAGNMLHCALLEVEHFGNRYVVVPESAPKKPTITQRNAKKPSPDTITAIDWWDRFLSDNHGKKVVSADKYDVAFRQADSLRKIVAVRELLEHRSAMSEVSEYAVDPVTGLYVKIRPDLQVAFDGGDVLADAKTTRSVSPHDFARTIATMRYHVQDGFYSDIHKLATGRNVMAFLFLAVESEWPYLSKVKELDDISREEGRRVYRRDLNGIKKNKDAGTWHNHHESVEQTSLPAWAFTEVDPK